ncbi:hypothetical protein D3C85_1379120 [compost metagenome]
MAPASGAVVINQCRQPIALLDILQARFDIEPTLEVGARNPGLLGHHLERLLHHKAVALNEIRHHKAGLKSTLCHLPLFLASLLVVEPQLITAGGLTSALWLRLLHLPGLLRQQVSSRLWWQAVDVVLKSLALGAFAAPFGVLFG